MYFVVWEKRKGFLNLEADLRYTIILKIFYCHLFREDLQQFEKIFSTFYTDRDFIQRYAFINIIWKFIEKADKL